MVISHFRLTVIKISRKSVIITTKHMIKNSSNLFKFLQIPKIDPKRALWAFKARVCAYLFTGHVCLMSHYHISWLHQFPLWPGLFCINLIGWYVMWVLLSDLVAPRGYLVSANCYHLRGFGGAGGCVGMDTGGRANEVSRWWDYTKVLMGRGTRAWRLGSRCKKQNRQQRNLSGTNLLVLLHFRSCCQKWTREWTKVDHWSLMEALCACACVYLNFFLAC